MRQVPSNWKEGQITVVLHVHDLQRGAEGQTQVEFLCT